MALPLRRGHSHIAEFSRISHFSNMSAPEQFSGIFKKDKERPHEGRCSN